MVFNFSKLLMPSTMVAVPAGIVVVSYIQKSTTLVPHTITPQPTPEDTTSKTVDTQSDPLDKDPKTPDPIPVVETTPDESSTKDTTVPPNTPPSEDTKDSESEQIQDNAPLPNPATPTVESESANPLPQDSPVQSQTNTPQQSSPDSSGQEDLNANPPPQSSAPDSSSPTPGSQLQTNTSASTSTSSTPSSSSSAPAIDRETMQKMVENEVSRKAVIKHLEEFKTAQEDKNPPPTDTVITQIDALLVKLKAWPASAQS